MEIFTSLKIFHLIFFLQQGDFFPLVDIFLESLFDFIYDLCPNLIFLFQIADSFLLIWVDKFQIGRCLCQLTFSFFFEAINNLLICSLFQFIWFLNSLEIFENTFKIEARWTILFFLRQKYSFNFIYLRFHHSLDLRLMLNIKLISLSFLVFYYSKSVLHILFLLFCFDLLSTQFALFHFNFFLVVFKSLLSLLERFHPGFFFLNPILFL